MVEEKEYVMKSSIIKTSISELIEAVEFELGKYKIHSLKLRNKLISIMISDILSNSRIVRNGCRF